MIPQSTPQPSPTAPAGSAAEPRHHEPLTGAWSWDLTTNDTFWSDEIYLIHGFQPGEVLPSAQVTLSHKHPDDLERCEAAVARVLEHGGYFSCYHRIIDTRSRTRHLLTSGVARVDADGEVSEIEGYMVDLTDARREDFQPAVDAALDAAFQSRGVIEQAKGVVMGVHRVDADTAFGLLRRASCSHNRKLRDVAGAVVASLDSDATSTDDTVADLLTSGPSSYA